MRVKTASLCRKALCIALMCVSSYIAIPLPFVHTLITAQTVAVNIAALLLSPYNAAVCMIVYTLIGAVGLPVFSGGNAGVGWIFGPNGGYILGFILAAYLISRLKGNKPDFKRYTVVTLVGMCVIHFFGIAVFAFFLKEGLTAAVASLILPLIPVDIAKCIASSYICVKLEKILKIRFK